MDAVRRFSLAVVAGVVLLVLGRPAGADAPPDEAPFAPTTETASVAGTVWEGVDLPEKFFITYRFEKDGVLVYSYNAGTYRDGKWKQEGDTVYFQLNGKYRECRGVVRDDQFEGDSWNVAGRKWQTTLHKSKSP